MDLTYLKRKNGLEKFLKNMIYLIFTLYLIILPKGITLNKLEMVQKKDLMHFHQSFS